MLESLNMWQKHSCIQMTNKEWPMYFFPNFRPLFINTAQFLSRHGSISAISYESTSTGIPVHILLNMFLGFVLHVETINCPLRFTDKSDCHAQGSSNTADQFVVFALFTLN